MISFGAIASAVKRMKQKKVNKEPISTHPIHTSSKEQVFKWLEEGKCQCCGADSGEFKGICDECRLS